MQPVNTIQHGSAWHTQNYLPYVLSRYRNERWRPVFSALPSYPKSVLSPSGYFANQRDFEQHYRDIIKGLCAYLAEVEKDVKGNKKPIIVAIDDLPMSHAFNRKVIDAIRANGFDVYTYKVPEHGYLPIPLGTLGYTTKYFNEFMMPHKQVAAAIMLTAGSRPLTIAGMRFINNKGGMFTLSQMAEIERQMQQVPNPLTPIPSEAKEYHFNFRKDNYTRFIQQLVSKKLIQKLKIALFYSPLHGAARNMFDEILYRLGVLKIFHFQDKEDPVNRLEHLNIGSDFNHINRKPLLKDMHYYNNFTDKTTRIGFLNNGDAGFTQTIGANNKLISSDGISAILLWHLAKNKMKHGVVIKTHDSSVLLDDIAELYGLPVIETPVGFSYVSHETQSIQDKFRDITILATDNQGGISTMGNVAVKDGMMSQLLLLELMGNTGLNLDTLLLKLQRSCPRMFTKKHYTCHVENPEKAMAFLNKFSKNDRRFAGFEVDWKRTTLHKLRLKQQFGINENNELKIFFRDDSWLLVRRRTNSNHLIDVWVEVNGKLESGWWKETDLSKVRFSHFENFFTTYLANPTGLMLNDSV